MNIREKIYSKKHLKEVLHTTLNPYEPGAVRIHLVPPKSSFWKSRPSIVILNGKDIIPINEAWAILLSIFINEVNKFEGKAIQDKLLDRILKNTVEKTRKIYKKTGRIEIKEDLKELIKVFTDIASTGTTDIDVGQMSIGEYAPNMQAPHRMDLMISSMIKNNNWNCNQKCIHCYAAGQKLSEKEELSTKEWKKVIDICQKECIPQLTFTGGEPTMRKDLVELIEYSKWFITRLNTNGVLLTEKLCKELYEASLDSVQVTLYSNNPEIHNKLVGADNFEKTITGIKNAINVGLNVSINTPLCTLNKNYIDTLKFAKELGITYVTCSGLIVTGNAKEKQSKDTQLSEKELYTILKDAKKYTDDNLMELGFTSPGWVKEDDLRKLNLDIPTCGACLSNMAIAPNGDVVPCQSWLDEKSNLGNILKTKWKKIWNNPICKKQREFSSKMYYTCPLKGGNNE